MSKKEIFLPTDELPQRNLIFTLCWKEDWESTDEQNFAYTSKLNRFELLLKYGSIIEENVLFLQKTSDGNQADGEYLLHHLFKLYEDYNHFREHHEHTYTDGDNTTHFRVRQKNQIKMKNIKSLLNVMQKLASDSKFAQKILNVLFSQPKTADPYDHMRAEDRQAKSIPQYMWQCIHQKAKKPLIPDDETSPLQIVYCPASVQYLATGEMTEEGKIIQQIIKKYTTKNTTQCTTQ